MTAFVAFLKKEILDYLRNGKLLLFAILFSVFGVMNPAIAKLTPWLMELFAEELGESGIIMTEVTVTALTSWVQFFKNVPMALIAFVLICGGAFTKEYGSGTMVLLLSKGLSRYKVVLAKLTVMISLWSAGYFLCFGVTYAYNAYFWDNSIATGLGFAVMAQWLIGVFVISATVFFSTVFSSSSSVLLGVGGVYLGAYVLSIIPKIGKFSPIYLINSASELGATPDASKYIASLVLNLAICVLFSIFSIPLFNKKSL